MTATDRDPVTLAREVLETAHEDDTITVCTIPDNKAAALARAVLRVAMLTDRLDDRRLGYQIRTTLNGENRG